MIYLLTLEKNIILIAGTYILKYWFHHSRHFANAHLQFFDMAATNVYAYKFQTAFE